MPIWKYQPMRYTWKDNHLDFLNVILLSPQPFIFYTNGNRSSPNVRSIKLAIQIWLYLTLLAFTFSAMHHHHHLRCLLPFLMTNFKEPLIFTFFFLLQKSTIICMNITEIMFCNEETVKMGLKYETGWRIFF